MSPALNQGIFGTRFSVYMQNIVSKTEMASKKADTNIRYYKTKARK